MNAKARDRWTLAAWRAAWQQHSLYDHRRAALETFREGFDAGVEWQRVQPCPRAEALAECQTERDSLAAQVAALDDLLTQLWRADAVPNALLEDVEVALADTEAAATTWLEAPRPEQVLEAMEREVGQ